MKKVFKKLFSAFEIYKGLPKEVYILVIADLINGIGAFVYPFLTLYLTTRLSFSDYDTGLFLLIFSTAYVPGSFISGKLSDKFSRKKTAVIAQSLMGVCYLVASGFDGSLLVCYLLLGATFFDGFCDPARTAMSQDYTTAENRQVAFSLGYTAYNLGFVVGQIIAGLLFFKAPSFIFLGAGILSFVSVSLCAFFLPEKKPTEQMIQESLKSNNLDKAEKGGLFKALASRPKLLIVSLAMSLVSMAYAQTRFGLPLVMVRKFGEVGSTYFGYVNSTNGLVVVLFAPLLMMLLRKRRELRNMSLGCLCFAIGFGLIFYCNNVWSYLACAVMYTFGEIIQANNLSVYIANNTPISHRARFNGVLPVLQNLGVAIGPWVGGMISEKVGLSFVWPFSASLCIVGAIIMLIVLQFDKRSKTSVKV